MLGMLMQRFEFVDHANYQLKIKESLTLKPDGLTITIRPRAGRTWGATPRPVAAAANAADPGAGRRARRPARHPAAGALRLEPRRVGGHRLADRPRRDRPRLHRPHRRARRRGRRAADRGRRRGRHLLLQRAAAGQRGEVLHVGRRRRDLGGRGALHRLRLRQPGLGRDLPGGADPGRRRPGGARRDPGVPARRRRRARRLRRPVRGLVRRAVGRAGIGARARRGGDGGGRERPAAGRGARAAPHGEPDPAVLPRPGRDRAGQPRAHRPRGHPGRPLGAPHRDRAAARDRPTPRATTSGCCRATTSR